MIAQDNYFKFTFVLLPDVFPNHIRYESCSNTVSCEMIHFDLPTYYFLI